MTHILIERAVLEQALDVIKSEVGLGGTNDYDPWAVAEALREALQPEPRTTGWPEGMLQDDSRDMSKWLANRSIRAKLDAMPVAKREHITDGTPCWCNPELDYVDPVTGAEVWVHKEPM